MSDPMSDEPPDEHPMSFQEAPEELAGGVFQALGKPRLVGETPRWQFC